MTASVPKLVANERVKLFAGALNTGATALFTVGVVAPMAARVYASASVGASAGTVLIGAVAFLVAAVALHAIAQWVLGGLRE